MSKHLNEIIKRLGYSESPYLVYVDNDLAKSISLTKQTTKILEELLPYAAYLVDKKPFILFFDELINQDEQKKINVKIWNAQIPIVIFCGTASIKIFNGCTINVNNYRLIEIYKRSYETVDEINEESPFSFWDVSSQDFWKKYSKNLYGNKLNDVLLNNLNDLTNKLLNIYHIPFAIRLVLRLIFIRYLIDRGVDLDYPGFSCDVEGSRKALLTLLNDDCKLYNLFSYLKIKFNGNLFEFDGETLGIISKPALNEIKDFLTANLHLNQYSFLTLYDFNIIPVELISSIYEVLLGSEARKTDNAFYTPKYLVDYILDSTIDVHLEKYKDCKILDPSCGSGIFLVDSYRRMIDKKLNGAHYTEDDTLLCETLKENIYGIDLSQNAIDVAIFSLYLAVLDYKNPKTLKSFHLPDLKDSNLLKCDFFDKDKTNLLQDINFDFIIGNPPWSIKPGLHDFFCKENKYDQYMQSHDTCHAFVLRSKDFCNKINNTTCCFVLKSKILYMQGEHSKRFRKYLLTKTKINKITELSSVRKLIFKDANAPAIVLSYNFTIDNALDNRFEHIAIKNNEYFRLFNIIVIEKTDVKSVHQKLLIENDWAWKTLVYGLTGDIDNISMLKTTYQTLKENIESQYPPLIKGTGVHYNEGDLKDASHLYGRPLLNSKKAINHFMLSMTNMSVFEKDKIDRPRNETLFKAPYCLVMRGPDMDDYTMKAVYSEIDFVYHEAIYGIKGTINQKNLLLNIVGLLNSNVYAYFNLMLGSSLGIEREQRQAKEVLLFPYVYSDEIAIQVEQIQNMMTQNNNSFHNLIASKEISYLNKIIYEAFGLSNNEFVDYALRIQIPKLTGVNNKDAIRKVNGNDLQIYGNYYYNYLTDIFSNYDKYIKINISPSISKHFTAFEVVILNSKPTECFAFINDDNKYILTKLSTHKFNDLFYSVKDVLYFDENSFLIIKPNLYRNWHPAIAKIDLMEITDQIFFNELERRV